MCVQATRYGEKTLEYSAGCGFWECSPPIQPAVLLLLGAVVVLFVWQSLRPPRRPDWWRSGRRPKGG
jgi:hypothetical protein